MFLNCYNYKKERIKRALNLLEKAIFNDDAEYMIDTIKYTNGLHINYIFKPKILKITYNMPLINFAARCNSINCIYLLINNNVDVNIYDGNGWLPIHYVSIYHEPYKNKALKLILSNPYVNINSITKKGKTIRYNNVKLNTKNKTALQLANHYLCYESCKIIEKYIKNKKYKTNKKIQLPIARMAVVYNPSAPLKPASFVDTTSADASDTSYTSDSTASTAPFNTTEVFASAATFAANAFD